MGHRGARFERPENTLIGIEHALECGVDGIEIDIHASTDRRLMVIHDPTLERTTNMQGEVSKMTSQELRKADAGQGQEIPYLEEVMELVLQKGRVLFIEAKGIDMEKELMKLLKDTKYSSQIILKCFHHRWLKEVGSKLPKIKKAALMNGVPADPKGLAESAGAQMLSLSAQTIDQTCVEMAHAAGIEVCTWNVNEAEKLNEYLAMGVDWLGTDRPSEIVPALAKTRV
jgi:glycerophosphoryl diester phosphodiesterase